MADTYAGLQRLRETHDFAVASDDPDIRGWDVVTDASQIGEVSDLIVDASAMKVRYVEVDLDRGAFNLQEQKRVMVPISSIDLDAASKQVRLTGTALTDIPTLPQYQASATHATATGTTAPRPATHTPDVHGDEARLTRAEEELHVGKREAEAGEVRVSKHVETEHVRQPVSVERERVRIERRPVEHATARDITIGEDEIRVPVIEEEVVVEKRAVVKEELVISKERVRETETVEADLRKERFDVNDDAHVLDRDAQPRTRTGGR